MPPTVNEVVADCAVAAMATAQNNMMDSVIFFMFLPVKFSLL
jgi:hypothetical protein